jgi:hypothetical protein
MLTLDLKTELKKLYTAAANNPTLLEVPPLPFLMIDGSGDPNKNPVYEETLSALYGLAYTLKFMLKKRGELDFNVMALEGLWWAENMAEFSTESKGNWLWTMMIVMPELVSLEHVEKARAEVLRKKGSPLVKNIRLETFDEGYSAQVLHLGPYSAEGPTVANLHEFILSREFERHGKHHEIYLGDPRRSAPEKLRTIIRQPVRRA